MKASRGLTRGFANPRKPHLLFDQTRSGGRRPEEQVLHSRKQLPDGVGHADGCGIADSRLAKFRFGLPPDFDPAAQLVLGRHLP